MLSMRSVQGIIMLMAILSAGCAASLPMGRVIHQEGESGKAESLVRLDRATEGAPFDHPAVVSPERLTAILSSVTVKRQAGLVSAIFGASPRPAFTEEEVTRLASHLSRALAEATPQELAVFYLNAPETGEQARITSGGISVRDGQVTVVLANYHYTVTWSDQASGKPHVSLRSARDNPLYTYPENDYRLVAGPGQELLGGRQSTMSRLFGEPRRGVVIALEPAPAAEPARAEEPAAVPPPAPLPSVSSGLEEKLRTLKKLRDEGLITEEDYERKKQELLESF